MISCPHCGALNRKGSRYCGNCGQSLATADTIPGTPSHRSGECPVCNGMNSVNSSHCTSCGATLPLSGPVAEKPVEEQSGPSLQEPAPAVRRELPPWLHPPTENIRETRPEATPPTSAVEPAATLVLPRPGRGETSRPTAVGLEASECLRGIRGVLPASDGWLASSISHGVAEKVDRSLGQ
jgi:hypothetical protein